MEKLVLFSALAFLLACIVGSSEGYRDAKNGTDPDHSIDFGWRLIFGAIGSMAIILIWFMRLLPRDNNFFYDRPFVCMIAFIFMFGGLGFLYGFFLDITHNLSKGKPITYVGNTADSDKFANNNNFDNWVLAKLAGGILSIIFYFAWVINAIS